jgi:hypothetical protein
MVTNCPMLYGKLLRMIDIEMLAAIMKELGYLDETEEDKAVKPNTDEPQDKPADKSKIDRPSES